MTGYNFNNIRINNRYEIIQKIYQNKDINRNYIAQATGLTGAAVTKIINSLIKDKYVSERNYYSPSRKRKARYLSINEGTFGAIVFYFGRTLITAAIADICGKIIYSRDYLITYSMINELIFNEIVIDTVRFFPKDITCLGCICVTPGIRLIDENDDYNNTARTTPYFWDVKKLNNILVHDYHIPMFTENDSNVALLGEKWFGKGRNCDNFVLYNIGKGIGAAVCIRGKLLRGYHSSSIEIGHVTINFKGVACDCGNKGCLELYTSIDNLEKRLIEENKYNKYKNRAEAMFINARQGDAESIQLVRQYSLMISEGAMILVNMFSPEKIIVTTNEADFIHLPPVIKTIKEELKTRIFSIHKQEICVEDSEIRKTNFILGGIAVLLEKQLFNV
jgi:predicted NBD/HSP70 family sugar kinase